MSDDVTKELRARLDAQSVVIEVLLGLAFHSKGDDAKIAITGFLRDTDFSEDHQPLSRKHLEDMIARAEAIGKN